MSVDHPHVRAIVVEPNELFGAFTEIRVIVARHAHVRLEQRKTANAAGEAGWNRRHLPSPYATTGRVQAILTYRSVPKRTVATMARRTVGMSHGSDTIAALRADVARETRRLHLLHAERIQCRRGCSSCCVDGLSVFEVEAQNIRDHHAELIATGTPHAEGACAFLDERGACRIYEERPYVCRTQGLPLRWIEERDGRAVELRDICPLNEVGELIQEMRADACWSIGPVEERLALLQLAAGAASPRTRLRDLFLNASNGHPDDGDRSSSQLEPKEGDLRGR
jgi:hypothetical protein